MHSCGINWLKVYCNCLLCVCVLLFDCADCLLCFSPIEIVKFILNIGDNVHFKCGGEEREKSKESEPKFKNFEFFEVTVDESVQTSLMVPGRRGR